MQTIIVGEVAAAQRAEGVERQLLWSERPELWEKPLRFSLTQETYLPQLSRTRGSTEGVLGPLATPCRSIAASWSPYWSLLPRSKKQGRNPH
jgi:hypothetical protein